MYDFAIVFDATKLNGYTELKGISMYVKGEMILASSVRLSYSQALQPLRNSQPAFQATDDLGGKWTNNMTKLRHNNAWKLAAALLCNEQSMHSIWFLKIVIVTGAARRICRSDLVRGTRKVIGGLYASTRFDRDHEVMTGITLSPLDWRRSRYIICQHRGWSENSLAMLTSILLSDNNCLPR